MANKLIKRRYNNLLTARRNYYAYAGPLIRSTVPPIDSSLGGAQNPNSNPIPSYNAVSSTGGGSFLGMDWSNPFKGANGAAAKGALTSAAGTAIGGIGGGLLSGGMTSGAGNLLQGLSGVAAAIPGPWGAVASAGLGLVGGLTNRMFGSKMNTENIAKVEANINNLKNFQSDASDFDTLSQNWANADLGTTFSNSFIGKDGWFSNKAKKKAADLRRQVEAGNAWVQNSLNNNAENIVTTQMQNLLANYAAFGGPLFAEGGRIHIKPENRGKFTETKRRTGKTTEELTHSKNPVTRKRAIFAQNAKKWHHAFGGDLMTHGADFDTGLILVGNGGTHEENPNEGVPMGMDSEGIPNLVEEGEVIFNDYVFSKRLKVPKAVRKKYKLRGTKPLTFADAAIQMSKESEERPNDPISKAGLIDSITKLMLVQEQIRERQSSRGGNKFAWGGNTLNSYRWDANYNAGNWMSNGAYTQDYLTRLEKMTLADWNQHLQDQRNFYNNEANRGTPRWNVIDYMYQSNPWMKNYTATEEDVSRMVNLAKSKPGFMHPIDVLQRQLDAERVPREKGKRMYLTNRHDASGTPLEDLLIPDYDPTTGTYKYVRTGNSSEGNVDYTDLFYEERPAEPPKEEAPDLTGKDNGEYPDYDNTLRYMPIIGSMIGLGTSLFTKPDDSDASAILGASSGKGAYRPVRYRPIGNYLTYRPFDRDYYINKMNAEAGASRRALMNTSGGNRAAAMAGILGADNNYLNQLGVLARQAEEYNLAQRQQVEEFNRATNIQNSQGFLQADMANQEALSKARDFTLRGVMAAADIRSRARLAREQAISDNLSNIFSSLGDIGREKVDRKWRTWASKHGVYAPVQKEAYGGRIKRKKRGLTF